MNRIYNKDQRLESHRWFPYVAWTLIVGFALFVYNLTTTVNEHSKLLVELQQQQSAQYGVQ